MKPGDAVRHPVLGDGAVISIASRGGDAGAEVDFGYMREWGIVGGTRVGGLARDGGEPAGIGNAAQPAV